MVNPVKVQIDSKGRIDIPDGFWNSIGLKDLDYVWITPLDVESLAIRKTLPVIPPPPPPPPTTNIYDNFDTEYTIVNGMTKSPNGKWLEVYTGYNPADPAKTGMCGVRVPSVVPPDNSTKVMFAYPYNTPNTAGKTNANLQLSTVDFTNFDTTFFMRTIKGYRSPAPKSWETVWLLFRFNKAGHPLSEKAAHTHHYFLLIHRDGHLDFGRKDNTTDMEEQTFLFESPAGTVAYKDGQWYKIRIIANGFAFKIYVDDKLVVDLFDDGKIGKRVQQNVGEIAVQPPSDYMKTGAFGPYAEDSEVEWGRFSITPLP